MVSYLWSHMFLTAPYRTLDTWLLMLMYGYVQLLMFINVYLWLFTIAYGYLSSFIITYGNLLTFPYGYLWLIKLWLPFCS
jgi:hypothetical protein